ncbi:MAG: division/cell wall cluster transcriptional repressor MraZ [Chitinophagaceae bacterium]
MHFLGEYESTVDSKGRFLLPAGFKKQLPSGETRFVISRGFEECLTLYPMQVWQPLHARISNLNQFDPKVRQFQRQFLGGATEVELDSAGRLLLPASLKSHAKLEKDITLVAQGDKLEIWDTANYKKLFDSFDANAFSVLANEVMGQQQIG